MQNLTRLFLVTAVAALALHATADVQAQQAAMTFFTPPPALPRQGGGDRGGRIFARNRLSAAHG